MMRNIPKNRKTMEEHGRALREEAQFCMSWFTGKPCSFERWPDAYGVAMLNGNGALHALNRFTALRRIICSYVILLYSELTPTDKTWPNQKHHECESRPVDQYPCHVPIKIDHFIWIWTSLVPLTLGLTGFPCSQEAACWALIKSVKDDGTGMAVRESQVWR